MNKNYQRMVALLLSLTALVSLGGCGQKSSDHPVKRVYPSAENTLPDGEDNITASVNTRNDELVKYVDEEIYLNLVSAKSNFENLLNNGDDVSTKMKNSGICLNDDECVIINEGFNNIYNAICNYVDSYELHDYDKCISAFDTLSYYYNAGLNRNFLFKILVSNNLPDKYQSLIKYGDNGSMYDSSKNIKLENGELIRLIGYNDDLLYDDQYCDEYDITRLISKWYDKLPSTIFSKYIVVNDNSLNDGVCYFWNETNVSSACNDEYYKIIEEGREMYGFGDDVIIISLDDDLKTYAFSSNDGENVYGNLTYQQNSTVDKVIEINNAIKTHEGNVLVLDSYIKDMYGDYNNTYNK